MVLHATSKSRSGLSLTEVLVAIFITGIGLLSLLVLFPLGVFNMAAAIKDQRSADAARNAESVSRMFKICEDPEPPSPPGSSYFKYYTSPPVGAPPPTSGPSYPLYVDPQACSRGITGNVGGASSGIRRVMPGWMASPQAVARWTTMLDDMIFETDSGKPDLQGTPRRFGGAVQRESRYSWAWMCRQVRATYPPATSAAAGTDLTIVVYDKRPLVGVGSPPIPSEEKPYAVSFTAGSNVGILSFSGTPPQIRRGTWVLDASPTPNSGYFYRIVSVTQLSGTQMMIELHQNARAAATLAVIMESVVEVFEKESQ